VAGYLGAHVDWLSSRLPQGAGPEPAAAEAVQGPSEPATSFVPVAPAVPGAPALLPPSRFFPPSD
jgi:hypothetical protein